MWATLREHQCSIRSLGFAPNGRELLSGDESGKVVLWSLESRRPLLTWEAHHNALLATKFWGDLVVTHGRDNALRIWDVKRKETPELVHEQDVNALNFCPVALGPDRTFATPASTASERIDVYQLDANFKLSRPFRALDASEGLPLDTQLDDAAESTRRGLLGTVMALQIYDTKLVAGYESGHIALFENGELQGLVQVHKSPVLSFEVAVENARLVAYVSSPDRRISRVDLMTFETEVVATFERKGVSSVSISEPLMTTAGWDGTVRLFERVNGKWQEVEMFPIQSGCTMAIISSVEPSTQRKLRPLPHKWIAVGGKNGRIGLFPVNSEFTSKLLN